MMDKSVPAINKIKQGGNQNASENLRGGEAVKWIGRQIGRWNAGKTWEAGGEIP